VPKRAKWGEGTEMALVGSRFSRWQREGSQPSSELEGKSRITGST
jgi:hypothetical protein